MIEAERDPLSALQTAFPPFPPTKVEPTVAPIVAPTPAVAAPVPAVSPFASDLPLAPGSAAPNPLLARLADFLRGPTAPTPFAIGLLAPAGGGKSSALAWLLSRLGAGGPPVARLDAASLAAEPEQALAAALYRALTPKHATLAAEAAQVSEHFGADAGAQARTAQLKLSEARGRLIAERQALADLQARRAALPETVLYETPGAEVDQYARKQRGAFEQKMRGFGLRGDALLTFKDFARDLAAQAGLPARILASLRSVYAYRGQTRLLVWAVLLFLASQGVDWLYLHRADWLDALSRVHDAGAQTADYLRPRLGFLTGAASLAGLAALACLVVNLWRAFAFSAPVLQAASLLDEDVATRAHEIDAALAHQQRNVEMIAEEASAASQAATHASRRAEASGAPKVPPAFLERSAEAQRRDQALGFVHGLSQVFARTGQRLVVAVDGYEKLSDGAALFARVQSLLTCPGFIAVHAIDPALCGEGEAQARLLQLPVRLDAAPCDPPAFAPLDAPLSPLEERLLAALGPLAGATPRAKKRLRNAFAFLRPAQAEHAPALALALAAEMGGGAERAALEQLTQGGHVDAAQAPRLAEFLALTQQIGGGIDARALSKAMALTRAVAG